MVEDNGFTVPVESTTKLQAPQRLLQVLGRFYYLTGISTKSSLVWVLA